MLELVYLNGHGIYVYSALAAAILPMSVYAGWVYYCYHRIRDRLHD